MSGGRSEHSKNQNRIFTGSLRKHKTLRYLYSFLLFTFFIAETSSGLKDTPGNDKDLKLLFFFWGGAGVSMLVRI